MYLHTLTRVDTYTHSHALTHTHMCRHLYTLTCTHMCTHTKSLNEEACGNINLLKWFLVLLAHGHCQRKALRERGSYEMHRSPCFWVCLTERRHQKASLIFSHPADPTQWLALSKHPLIYVIGTLGLETTKEESLLLSWGTDLCPLPLQVKTCPRAAGILQAVKYQDKCPPLPCWALHLLRAYCWIRKHN